MKCQNCGKEVNPELRFCDNCGAPVMQQPQPPMQNNQPVQFQQSSIPPQPIITKKKKPLYKKWWFWVLMGLATFFVYIIGIAAIGGSDSDEAPTTTTTVAIETTAEVKGEEPKTEEQTTETTEKATEAQTESTSETDEFVVGETYKDDYFEICFKTVEDYNDYDDYEAPAKGNKIIRAYFEINNISNDSEYTGSWDFSCYADSEKIEQWYCWADDAQELEAYVELSKGRTTKGYIYYEVPTDAEVIEIEYEPTESLFSDEEPVIFKVK